MKTNERQFQLKISAVDFVVTPLSISFKSAEPSQYFLEFDKGAQILKKFEEEVHVDSDNSTYQFSSGEHGRFKLQTERACSCEWGIYRVSSNEMSEFVDSLPASLQHHYTAFAGSLRAAQADYLRVLAERAQGREISRLWEAVKERCQWQFPELVAKNRSGSIELCFRLEIRCEADGWSEAEKRKSTKSLKSIRSIGEKQLNGSLPKQSHEEDELLPKSSVIKPIEVTVRQPHKNHHVHFSEELIVKQESPSRISEAPPQMEREQAMSKKGSDLSDIIERSVQCSSNLNDREKRNELKDILDIPEEESEPHSPHMTSLSNAKTQNFEEMGSRQDDALKRRSNTFGSASKELPEEIDLNLGDNRRTSLPDRHVNRDEQLGKEELRETFETLPQSEVSQPAVQSPSEAKRSGRAKYIIIFVLCLVFIGALAFSAHLEEETPKVQPKKAVGKLKKPEQRKRAKKGKQ